MLFQICSNLQRAWNKLIVSPIKKRAMETCGINVKLGRGLRLYGPENLNLGDNIGIGENAVFMLSLIHI